MPTDISETSVDTPEIDRRGKSRKNRHYDRIAGIVRPPKPPSVPARLTRHSSGVKRCPVHADSSLAELGLFMARV